MSRLVMNLRISSCLGSGGTTSGRDAAGLAGESLQYARQSMRRIVSFNRVTPVGEHIASLGEHMAPRTWDILKPWQRRVSLPAMIRSGFGTIDEQSEAGGIVSNCPTEQSSKASAICQA